MAMTNTEQNTLFQAIKGNGNGQVVILLSNQIAGQKPYVLCNLVPVQTMSAAEVTAFAAIYSVTIASA